MAEPDELTWSPLLERPIARPTREERAAAIARQEAWGIARGVRCDAIDVVLDAAGDSTVRARRAIAQGEVMVSVPRSLVITGDVAALAAWLTGEARRADSPWRPFLDVLPVAFPDMPVFRGGADLAALAGTFTRRLAAKAHANIVEAHAALAGDVRAEVTLAEYAWARGVISSRGFNGSYVNESGVAFIPIIDLMNHGAGGAHVLHDAATSSCTVLALRDFAPGEEITLDYGATSNARLLVDYGFALAENPNETFGVRVEGTAVVHPDFARGLFANQGSLHELERAVRAALARLAAGPATDEHSSWLAACARVRRSERRLLEHILAIAIPDAPTSASPPSSSRRAFDARGEPTWSPLPARAVVPPTRDERAAAIARYEAWARADGAELDAVEIVLDASGESALLARTAMTEGDVVASVPRALVISGERESIATWLAREAPRADSRWRPLLDVLPVWFPDLPMFRGGADLDALAGTVTRWLAADAHASVVDGYAALAADLRSQLPLAEYAWARAVLSSRGFDAPFTLDPLVALIPIIDLMNHRRGETSWRYQHGRVEVVAERPFAPGDEVTFDYGAKSNARLLVHYGFALDDNPHDEAGLRFGEPILVGADFFDAVEIAGGSIAALEAAARDGMARLDRHGLADEGASSWQAACARVRRGERRVLEQILATVSARRA